MTPHAPGPGSGGSFCACGRGLFLFAVAEAARLSTSFDGRVAYRSAFGLVTPRRIAKNKETGTTREDRRAYRLGRV
ncbi:uncharacterized protein B0I36DRAFT_317465 [Microdochium trichocladiopsis]|uniref:Uncharacterized protein n=1 Tax=Microdochium trichocladiopsis TaxID=1682393 RepID=A0A9P8YAQ0_9PEZI|nr:uncharacterized protein B0I36DRAFT_317465 [Microdochium trichocladiopsis]KAH7035033.1 hypothetical protein B0I36DRAFT_317465 [Microdochium trichocladiopsis]